MQKNAIIRILMKVVIIVLAVVIYLVIDKQAEIRMNEDAARELSRERMSILKEALNHYAQINKEYTTDFNQLLNAVRTDSVLNSKKKLVDLTNELLSVIDGAKSDPLLYNTFEVKKAIKELNAILEEVVDNYKQSTEIMEKTLSIKEDIESFESQNDFFDFASILSTADSLNYLSIEVNEFMLQEAVAQSNNYIMIIKSHTPNADINGVAEYWANIHAELKALELLLDAPDQEDQVFTNRYLKHSEIIQKRMTDLKALNLQSEIAKLESVNTEIGKLRDKFTSQENFALTSRSALKGLDKDEQLLVQINESTINAPPLPDAKFKIEILNNGLGYRISCPNEDGEFNVGLFSQRYMNYGNIETGEKSWEAN